MHKGKVFNEVNLFDVVKQFDKVNLFNEVKLTLAEEKDARLIHDMKVQAFMPLYEKYGDDETSPAKKPLEKTIKLINQRETDYYIINYKNQPVGAARIVEKEEGIFHISPLFVIPEFQNRGIASRFFDLIYERYPHAVTWKLATIQQEERDCHLYKKVGFLQTGSKTIINDKMTIVGFEKSNMTIRRFQDHDAEKVADLVIRNFKEVNIKDYGVNAINELVKTHDASWVRQVASYAHMYVFCLKEQIIACGSISSFWGSLDESILLTVFVLPEYHGKGIGRKIIQTLEEDEIYIRAKRIEIPASITAFKFYQKFGYDFKGGVQQIDEEGVYRLERFKEKGVN